MTATVQMNVRMDANLKKAGDEALASIGLTPTETVRMVWEAAADRKQGLAEIEKLSSAARSSKQAASSQLHGGFADVWEAVDRFVKERGYAGSPLPDLTDEELLEEALVERMEERGLM